MLKSMRILGAAAIMAAALAGSVVAQDGQKLGVVDDRGVAVEVPANPQRIASVSYFATDAALALGVKPVATTYMVQGREPDFLAGHTKDMKQIGQRAQPNLELLAEAKPDVTIAIRRYTEGNAAQYQKIGDHWVEAHGPIARQMVLREAAHYLYPDTFAKPDIASEAAKFIPTDLK